jgi:hypothetical protein
VNIIKAVQTAARTMSGTQAKKTTVAAGGN